MQKSIYLKMNYFIYSVSILLTLITQSHAGQVYIPVGQAKIKKSVLAMPNLKTLSSSGQAIGQRIFNTVRSDLVFMDLFQMQPSSAFLEKDSAGLTIDSFKMSDWTAIGTEFLLKSAFEINDDSVQFEVRLYDVASSKQIFGKRFSGRSSDPQLIAHTAANELIEALTGKPGIFTTKIAMTCDKSGTKEIWVTDFDGSNPKKVTNHKTLAFSPAWHPDGNHIAYSVYTKNAKNIKNIDLYELDLKSGKSMLLSNRNGINSGAHYSPDGRHIALTMSFLGNAEIFELDTVSKEVTRLTKSLGVDVDPTYAPDGKKLAFVSSRSGKPMIYAASVSDLRSNPTTGTRLTYAGVYNATPSYSPDAKKIAFAGYIDRGFDIFIMNADGSKIERLTKDEGNNEDPSFSPDGNFVVFSSNRAGQKNIYIISVDGTYTQRITHGLGQCSNPKWR